MEVEEALKKAGSWGKYQKKLLTLVFLCGIPNGMISMHFLVSNYKPEHRCKIPGEESFPNRTLKVDELVRRISENIVNEGDNSVQNGCSFITGNLSSIAALGTNISTANKSEQSIRKCENGYVYKLEPYQKSAVTEYSMICDDEWWMLFAISMYQIGNVGGASLASLGDKFGRKPTYRVSCVLHILGGLSIALSWNVFSYGLFNFLCGVFAEVNFLLAFLIATEMTDSSKRNLMGIFSYISYAIGYCLVAPIAYLQQDWRWCLGIVCGLSAVIYLPTFCFIPETLTWLVEKGHTKEAKKSLLKIAKINGRKESIEKLVEDTDIIKEKRVASVGILRNLKTLFRTGIGARYLALSSSWFAEGMVYYAISWFSKSFSRDRFLNILYAGLAEYPGQFLSYKAVAVIGRPRSLSLFLLICGLSLIILPFVPADYTTLNTIISVVGKTTVLGAYFISYINTSELAPTLQRSTCMSVCGVFSTAGAMSAPYVMYLGNSTKILPSIILSAVAIASGILVIFYLPETRGVPIPDTIEQAKANTRVYKMNILKKFDHNRNVINRLDKVETEKM